METYVKNRQETVRIGVACLGHPSDTNNRTLTIPPHIRGRLYDILHAEIARQQKRAAAMLPRATQRRQVEADIAGLRSLADELAR